MFVFFLQFNDFFSLLQFLAERSRLQPHVRDGDQSVAVSAGNSPGHLPQSALQAQGRASAGEGDECSLLHLFFVKIIFPLILFKFCYLFLNQ